MPDAGLQLQLELETIKKTFPKQVQICLTFSSLVIELLCMEKASILSLGHRWKASNAQSTLNLTGHAEQM